MITRQQYMARECSFEEYYEQFVTEGVKSRVLQVFNINQLTQSVDLHLNDVGMLKQWDIVLAPFPSTIGDKMRECGDFPTMAGAVCIAKEAARRIIAESHA